MIKSAPGIRLAIRCCSLTRRVQTRLWLGGALDHFPQTCSLKRAPIFKLDEFQTLESMDLIEDWLLGRNARVLIERDFVVDALLNKFPACYE